MEAKEARRLNLVDLAKDYGSLEALADKTGSNPAHLSQIKGRTRSMGAVVARRFEKKLGLAPGWMDSRDHGPNQKFLETAALVSDFEALPPALRDHVAKVARELRELIESLPAEIRAVIAAPPTDPARYSEWEANIRALIASEGR